MQRPPADPAKLLDAWMEWERGDITPGRVMANLKTAGLRELLESLAAAVERPSAPDAADDAEPGGWTPVV